MRKREIWVYAIVWAIVFTMAPIVLGYHVATGHDHDVNWPEVWHLWRQILPAFLLFVLHDANAEYFLRRRKLWPYITITLLLMGLYAYVCIKTAFPPQTEPFMQGGPPPEPFGGMSPPELRPAPDGGLRPIHPEVLKILLGVLLLGVNLGVKSFLSTLENEKKLKQAEADSLSLQLESLRYQINPHFFMNTLNNIHALVDIDPEKAKESIEEFSKLMRYVLYDGNAPTIPLSHEVEFLRHYVSLMRLRYPDSIEITLDAPEKIDAAAQIPPLVMASYVENAFKHGISYERPSFVRISISIAGGSIVFHCANSRNPEFTEPQHGIGQENVRARLDLLYGKSYTLKIDQQPDLYDILLVLPEKHDKSPLS